MLPTSRAAPRAYEDIVAQIEQSVESGALSVGDQLPGERDLSRQFGVSRVAVREAIRNLEARGIIEVRVGSGTYIRALPGAALSKSFTLWLQLEDSSVLDLYAVRQALEAVAAPLAAVHATFQEISELRRLLDEWAIILAQRPYTEEHVTASDDYEIKFHCLIASASRNTALETLLRAILPLILAGRWVVVRSAGDLEQAIAHLSLAETTVEHNDIYTAISNHDPAAAEFFTRRHMQTSVTIYRNMRSSCPSAQSCEDN